MASSMLITALLAAIGSILWLLAHGQLLEEKSNGSAPPVPALMVFGDSTVDVRKFFGSALECTAYFDCRADFVVANLHCLRIQSGNNNELSFSVLKANFYPYGIDFPNHEATGRFGNGYVPTDFIAEKAGLPLPPPYFNSKTQTSQYSQGVNFASGGSGTVPSTAAKLGVISLETQLQAFKYDYRAKLVEEVGEDTAAHIIKESMYVLSTGTNDYLNNYLNDQVLQVLVPSEQFQDQMVNGTVAWLEAIHEAGGRRMASLSLITLGCLPSQKTRFGADILNDSECVEFINKFAKGFNSKMGKAMATLQEKYTDSIMRFTDVYGLMEDIVLSPEKYDMIYKRDACCGLGLYEAAIACNAATNLCSDASKYVFWDSFHPSQQSYKVISDFLWENYSADLLADLPSQ